MWTHPEKESEQVSSLQHVINTILSNQLNSNMTYTQ